MGQRSIFPSREQRKLCFIVTLIILTHYLPRLPSEYPVSLVQWRFVGGDVWAMSRSIIPWGLGLLRLPDYKIDNQ